MTLGDRSMTVGTRTARVGSWLAVAAALCLAGCASESGVVLRDPSTGQAVVCPGDYAPGGIPSAARMRASEEQSDCVWRLRQRGFEATQGG